MGISFNTFRINPNIQFLTVRPGVEGKFQVASTVIYPIPWFLVVAVNVSKPADTPSYDPFQIVTMLIKQDVICLCKKFIRTSGKLPSTAKRTSSFGTSATANGLLGCTLGDVTDGHPFLKYQVSVTS